MKSTVGYFLYKNKNKKQQQTNKQTNKNKYWPRGGHNHPSPLPSTHVLHLSTTVYLLLYLKTTTCLDGGHGKMLQAIT
jgi:hypothetical protein